MSFLGGNQPAIDAVILYANSSLASVNTGIPQIGAAIDTNGSSSVVWEVGGNSAFQMTVEGSNDTNTWVTLWSLPLSEVAQVDTINQNGHYVFDADTRWVRYNLAYASGNLNFTVYGRDSSPASAAGRLSVALDQASNVAMSVVVVNLKKDATGALIGSDAVGPFIATLQNAQTIAQYDTTGYNSIVVQQILGAATTVQISNDGLNWTTTQGINLNTGAVVTTLAAAGIFAFSCAARYIRFVGTATAGQITSYFRQTSEPAAIEVMNLAEIGGSAVNQASSQLGINLVNMGGTGVAASIGNGSTNKGLGITEMTAVVQVDLSAVAAAGSGSVTPSALSINSTQGGGGVISAEINFTVLTLGTATAVYAILQESTGGTNFTDIWTSDPVTTTGIIRVPAIAVAGRRRWRFFSLGGTSTTVTVTVNTMELSSVPVSWARQMRDAFAATNPFASMINSATSASTLVSTTINSTSTIFNIEGCTQVTMFITVSGGVPGTFPIYTLQVSQDGTNWANTIANCNVNAVGTFMSTLVNQPAKYGRLMITTASATGTPFTIVNTGVYGIR